jgi:hypothetical protein
MQGFKHTLLGAVAVAATIGFGSAAFAAGGGYVVAGVTGAKAAHVQSSSLLYRSRDGNVSGKLSFKAGSQGSGDLVATAELPPGDYEIYDYFIRRRTSEGTMVMDMGGNVALPFTVKAGETTYGGAFRATDLEGATGLHMLVADHSQENLATARAAGAQGNVNMALPDPKLFEHAVVNP